MKTITTSLCSLALVASLAAPAQGQGCVEFEGIDHCAVGEARLSGSPDSGVNVSGLSPDGTDGVRASFAPTTHWRAKMEFPSGTSKNNGMHLSSIATGESTSNLYIEPVDGQFQVKATFTGASGPSTYSVLVYNDGILQGALGGFSGAPAAPAQQAANVASAGGLESVSDEVRMTLYVDGIRMGTIDVPWWWVNLWGEFGIANGGGCNWGLAFAAPVAVSLPDGQNLVGDEIRFQEDVSGPGHYPYLGFEAIETRTTIESFRVTEELAAGQG